jgi:hypothetical protein
MAKKHKKKHKHRNNGGGSRPSMPPSPSRPRRNRGTRRNKPDLWTLASAVGGGVGGAMLGGWAARKGYDARWVGAGLAGLGGLAAYKLDGNARSASYGLAAAGVGQSVLEWLDKDEEQATNDNKGKGKNGQQAKEEGASQSGSTGEGELTYVANKPAASRNSARGLDRAFNRVRDRLARIYDDDQDDDRFVEDEEDAA